MGLAPQKGSPMYYLSTPRRLLTAASLLASTAALAASSPAANADASTANSTVGVTASSPQNDLTAGRNAQTMPEYMTDVYNDVNSFWTGALTAAGDPLPNPRYVWMPPGESVNQACSDSLGNTTTDDSTAAYCSTDNTIYFSQQMATNIWQGQVDVNGDGTIGTSGGFSVAYALAHEYAHSIQHALGIYDANPNVAVKQFELQADCLAGVWAHGAYEHGELQGDDIQQAVTATQKFGDYDFSDPGHHGTPAERSQAFMLGYNTGQGTQCTLNLGDPNAGDSGGTVIVFN
jgi:predicted metalloprotease